MRLAAALAVLLASGCSFADPAPVRARPWYMPAPSPAMLNTAWGVVYCDGADLDTYTREPLTPTAAALIEHEQTHARRQHEAWILPWMVRYELSAAFRWQEERAGYAAQFAALRAAGLAVDEAGAVAALTDPFYRGMCSEVEAREWIRSGSPPP